MSEFLVWGSLTGRGWGTLRKTLKYLNIMVMLFYIAKEYYKYYTNINKGIRCTLHSHNMKLSNFESDSKCE